MTRPDIIAGGTALSGRSSVFLGLQHQPSGRILAVVDLSEQVLPSPTDESHTRQCPTQRHAAVPCVWRPLTQPTRCSFREAQPKDGKVPGDVRLPRWATREIPDVAYVACLAVTSESRGMGYGGRMLRACEGIAKLEWGYSEVNSWAPLPPACSSSV